jgi:hypothetical protein
MSRVVVSLSTIGLTGDGDGFAVSLLSGGAA